MSDTPERPVIAVMPPQNTGGSVSMGVSAPIGAVSRKDRERAAKTALLRDDPTTLLLTAELPGRILLERRGEDGAWETVEKYPASRSGRTRIAIPQAPEGAAPGSRTFRVVFAPKNVDITSWVSEDIEA
jgi:hypothetical protein